MGTLRELHPNPRFTKYLIEKKVFKNEPLVVVDVGARKGFEKHWNHYGDQIKLIGFEPNKDSYRECVEKKSNDQTTYYPYALDRHKGERDLYITAYPSSCGFYKLDPKISERFGLDDYLNIIGKEKVETIDLDTFVNENNIESIDFIKLDTEGSELDILKGGGKTVSSVLGLSVEVEFVEFHKGQPLFSDVDQYLRTIGFELYDFDLNRSSKKALTPYASANLDIGQIIFGQALYLRDPVEKLDSDNSDKEFWYESRILKMATIQELFNLPDCSLELIQKCESMGLFKSHEIKKWQNLLVPQLDGKNVNYDEYIYQLRVAKPRIDYNKKRKYGKVLKIVPWPFNVIIRRALLKIRDFINLFL